jgi:RNA polymerase sigma-B factor
MSAIQPSAQIRCCRQERALFERIAAGDDAHARDELIERFLPLARALAVRYQHFYESLEDLLQVASLGLVKAVDGFDPTRDSAFTSVAVPAILRELRRDFRDHSWAVRLPRSLHDLSLDVDRAVDGLVDELRRQPSLLEIAAAVGAEQERILDALQAGGAYQAVSFDASRDADEDALTLADATGIDDDGFDRAEYRATLDALLELLTEREREVLRLRFDEDMKQTAIGAEIGVSQMQVSRIIRRALARLRASVDLPVTSSLPD